MATANASGKTAGELLADLGRDVCAEPVPLGGYDVLRVLGRGGMGAVYEARDRARGVLVALKTVQFADATGSVQLKREFRVVADLAHPNLAAVYELVWAEGLCFFAMEYVEGVDFETWARGERGVPATL